MRNRIKTTHVGSLIRPPALVKYLRAIEDGIKVDSRAYESCLRESIVDVIKKQKQAGIDIVSDGEFGKHRSWSFYILDRLAGIPEEKIRYHICWGSFNTPHVSDVPLTEIIDLVLDVNAGAYCIEMGNPRHAHEWKVFKSVKFPDGKKLIPGVISHSTNVVEHPELVAERLVRMANLVGRENIMGGTDCGFAQSPFLQRVHPSIQWAKLGALAEGARLASNELWCRSKARRRS